MNTSTTDFKARVRLALNDRHLEQALGRARDGFVLKRRKAVDARPDFEALRDQGVAIRDHTLDHLEDYLDQFIQAFEAQGGQVHRAADAEEARRIVLDICAQAGARRVTKGKSMVAEEVGLNEALDDAGYDRVETDLGEYIIQLAHETPSHIIAPAVHKTREQITELFHEHHRKLGFAERVTSIPGLVNEARSVLRERFLTADVGITGANFLVAENGASVIVTNEGNGDLTATLPRVHVSVTGIERVVPTLEDMTNLLRLLGRSATGQVMTSYTTLSTGPRRADDTDGPLAHHVVLVDNGRSGMLADPRYRAMLRCIRCGACLNHCPVYGAIGGHAYGWVYPGPMGSVLTPLTRGLGSAQDLPQACTLNGHCAEVCPVKIPLPELLRGLREYQFEQRVIGRRPRWAVWLWGQVARRPGLYRPVARWSARTLGWLGRGQGVLQRLPMASGWFKGGRYLPVPEGRSFLEMLGGGDTVPSTPRTPTPLPGGERGSGSEAEGSTHDLPSPLGGEGSGMRGTGSTVPEFPRTPTSLPGGERDFESALEQAAGTVEWLDQPDDIPRHLARVMQQQGLDGPVVVAPALAHLDWAGAGLAPRFGPALGDETVGLSQAVCGVAETGTLVLASGADDPTTINFLPEYHFVVLASANVVDRLEDAWMRLRERDKPWPRTVNLITGPSRTADVEQTIQLGAHGPRSLKVFMLS
ncbi:LUD domain-containing protein [Ectothiorhodospira haloalkaliphila]|uniref:LUD domain-containing protein n=1 Tax=Ectothiorhodospira haloalkaliphila TaxID=421628 RepID=UPI0030846D95